MYFLIIGLQLLFIGSFLFTQTDFILFPERSTFFYTLSFVGMLFCAQSKKSLTLKKILILSGLLGLCYVGTFSEFSDDSYRYLAEGKAITQGINPYTTAPDSYSFQDAITSKVNHADYTAIYPPLFQLLMASIVSLSYSITLLQLVALFSVLITTVVLYKLFQFKKSEAEAINVNSLILFAWNPFVMLEGVKGAHIEIFIACSVILALYLVLQKKEALSSISLGTAVALKWIPGFLLPVFFLSFIKKRNILLTSLPVVLSLLFFITTPFSIFSSLLTYLGKWEFGSPLYYLLQYCGLSKSITKGILLFSFLCCLGYFSLLVYRKKLSLEKSLLYLYFIFPYYGAVVYPWYLLPCVALLPLVFNWGVLIFSYCSFLTYAGIPLYRAEGIWYEAWWISGMMAIPLIVFILLDTSIPLYSKGITKFSKKV